MMAILGVLAAVAWVIPFWRLFQRLGYAPWLSIAMLIPFVNLGLLYYVAFLDFPGQDSGDSLEGP